MNEYKSIIVPEEVGVSSVNKISVRSLEATMRSEAEKRALMTGYISQYMKDGVDYGTIKIGGRDSKPSLFKPGSEKFLSLFKLTARFEKDSDTWDMAGSQSGTFAYKCLLYATNGNVVGEGRGVSKLTEKTNWTINNAVKIAEKRAQIDAVLRTGALSDFFTQDLEDMPQSEPMKSYKVPRVIPPSDDEAGGAVIREGQILSNDEIEAVDDMKKDEIRALMGDLGYKNPKSSDIKKESGIDPQTKQFDSIIGALKARSPIEKLTEKTE